MAEGKDKKAPSKVTFADENAKLMSFLFMLVIIGALFARFTAVLESNPSLGIDSLRNNIFYYFSNNVLPTLYVVSFVLSAIFLFGIVLTLKKLTALNKEVYAKYHPFKGGSGSIISDAEASKTPENNKWKRVLSHLNTENQNDWKFAILEADIMLADLLSTLQYNGATVADKLKNVEPSDFLTLEAAWEAHKIRNTIAHEGADFVLSEREARRVIDLYRAVFEEFQII